MTVTRETLMAFVDGELAPDEEHRVAAEVAKDPALTAYVERQRTLAATLKSAFAPVLEAPIPERIERAVRETPIPSAGLLARLRRYWQERRARAGQTWIPAAALAASVALGVALDGSFGTGDDMRTKDGALVAQGPLAQALTLDLASEQTADTESAARIGVSFRSGDGAFCRSFETKTRGPLAGIACLKDGGWQLVALTKATPHEGEFTTAGGDMPAVIRSALSAMIAGDPLDAAQERAARDRGWRPQ